MPHDVEGLADVVVMTVRNAMAPVLERLAVAEATVARLAGVEASVTGLRERVVVAETKASAVPALSQEAVDLIRTHVEAMYSTKSLADPSQTQWDDLRRKVEAIDGRPWPVIPPSLVSADDVTGLRDRLIVIETKASGLVERLSQPDPLVPSIIRAEHALAGLTKDIGTLRERVAVVEVKGQLPGPAGEPGAPGKDGVDGKDGSAGLSFEGVHQDGQTYEKGAFVTWAGSGWHCNGTTTTKPGEGSKDWTLAIKRGRDGKDGKDAVTLPVVTVGHGGR